MGSVSVQNVTKQFGSQIVLQNVSVDFHSGQIVGVVGPNGAGKTTLFKLIAGMLSPDLGTVTSSKGLEIGYLPQEPDVDSTRTLHDEVASVFADLFALETKLDELSDEMAARHDQDDLDELMARYDRINAQFIAAGGYGFEQSLNEILGGLGFLPAEWKLPVAALSGGQKCRAALAKLLLQDRQLLLLDEPTNHLDIDAVRWLEKFLAGHHGGALIISHDRYLLDRVADRIVEVDRTGVSSFPGNYTNYARTKALRRLTQERQYEKDKAFIEKERAFIAKHLAGQRTKEAQGRRTRLERRLESGEFVLERPGAQRTVAFKFKESAIKEGTILRAEGLTKRYDEKRLFEDLSLQLDAGQRLGITGPNGSGKTTLLRILLGRTPADSGEFEFHSKADIGYYAQETGGLDPEQILVQAVQQESAGMSEQEARSLLARFQFAGEDAFKKLGMLSGGEQSRVRLIRLLLKSPNVLILDEPTNHLDIPSREALEEALLDFPGTIITVSHDRYFLDRIVNRLLIMRPTGCRLYSGNYSDYIRQTEGATGPANGKTGADAERTLVSAAAPEKRDGRRPKDGQKTQKSSGPSRTARFNSLTIEELENMLIAREEKIAELNERFADPEVFTSSFELGRLHQELEAAKAELAEIEEAWSERVEES